MKELEQSELLALLRVKVELFEHKRVTSITKTVEKYYQGKADGVVLAIAIISKYGAE